jgi:hypothetical protein
VNVFRTGHYDAAGLLFRAADAFPNDDVPTAQAVADRCARAADAGCTYRAGTFLVWVDQAIQPPRRIESAPKADGSRSYGHVELPQPPS